MKEGGGQVKFLTKNADIWRLETEKPHTLLYFCRDYLHCSFILNIIILSLIFNSKSFELLLIFGKNFADGAQKKHQDLGGTNCPLPTPMHSPLIQQIVPWAPE